MVKRYWLYTLDEDEWTNGFNRPTATFDTLEEAMAAGAVGRPFLGAGHIADVEGMKIVARWDVRKERIANRFGIDLDIVEGWLDRNNETFTEVRRTHFRRMTQEEYDASPSPLFPYIEIDGA